MRGSSPRMTTEWIKSTGNRYSRNHALIEAHHLKRGAAKRAVGIVQRLADLVMIVVLGDDEPDGLAGGLQGGSELPGLALKFRRFQGAVQQRHRAIDAFEMTLRTERILGGIAELHIV